MASGGAGSGAELSDLLTEERRFEPSAEFRRLAYMRTPKIREQSWADPEAFWDQAAQGLHWFRPWRKALRVGSAERQMVRRRADQRLLTIAWTATSRRASATRPR